MKEWESTHNSRKDTHIEKETLLTFGAVGAAYLVICQVESCDEGETTHRGEE